MVKAGTEVIRSAEPEDRGLRLGIDTATRFLSLALVDAQGAVLAESTSDVWRDHAARVVAELDALFETAGLEPRGVSRICVGTGPGSYTGLRIGVATARGLGYGWGVPVAGGDTLGAMAATEMSPGEPAIAAIDARRGNVYYGIYRLGPEGLETLAAPSKAERSHVVAGHPDLRIIEEVAPSAVWHARAATERPSVSPVYL